MTRFTPAPLPPLHVDRSPRLAVTAARDLIIAALVVAIIVVLAVAAGVRP